MIEDAGGAVPRTRSTDIETNAVGSTQMDEIICRSVRKRTSPAEEEELQRWRRSTMRNERYFRDLARVLQEARDIDSAVPVPPRPTGTELIALGSRPYARSATRSGWRRSDSRFCLPLLSMAAALALVVTGLVSLDTPAGEAPFSYGTGEVATGVGETATVKLGDGTIVRLAPESRLRTMGKDDLREVWLEGRAFF